MKVFTLTNHSYGITQIMKPTLYHEKLLKIMKQFRRSQRLLKLISSRKKKKYNKNAAHFCPFIFLIIDRYSLEGKYDNLARS